MNTLAIARLTIRETQRRRILWVGALMGIGFLIVYGLGFHFIYVDISQAMSPEEFRTPFLFLSHNLNIHLTHYKTLFYLSHSYNSCLLYTSPSPRDRS